MTGRFESQEKLVFQKLGQIDIDNSKKNEKGKNKPQRPLENIK